MCRWSSAESQRAKGIRHAQVSAADRGNLHAAGRDGGWRRCDAGKFPLVLGGDHSIAVGTVAGVSQHFRKRGEKLGLIWIDAHADMNTPDSSPSGNVHGMPLACCVGLGPPELTEHLRLRAQSGSGQCRAGGDALAWTTRSAHVQRSGVHAFTMRDIDERGMRAVMEEAIRVATRGHRRISRLARHGCRRSAGSARASGTPVRGGATYREAHLAMEMICDTRRMLSMEVVEVNPVIDEVNRTAIWRWNW